MNISDLSIKELNERISGLFEQYKEKLNCQQHSNVNYLLYNVNITTDNLLYKVKYEIDKFLKENGIGDPTTEAVSDSTSSSKKSQCLMKLQTVTSEVTCLILDDLKTKIRNDI